MNKTKFLVVVWHEDFKALVTVDPAYEGRAWHQVKSLLPKPSIYPIHDEEWPGLEDAYDAFFRLDENGRLVPESH